MPFAILWSLFPLVLIPFVWALAVKHSNIKRKNLLLLKFIYNLYQQGKISELEYSQLSNANKDYRKQYYQQYQQQQYQQPMQQGSQQTAPTQPIYPAATQSMPTTYPQQQQQPAMYRGVMPAPVYQQMPPTYAQPTYTKKQKDPVSAINVILIIGVFFIILAGLIFATTTWQFLSSLAKICSISSLTAMFFGVSILAEKKLKLYKTSIAFFTLGSIFIPITVLAIGFFSLLGHWFSIYGDGEYLLSLIAAATFGAICAIGSKKYQSKYFTWCSLSCITISVYLFLKALYLQPDFDVLGLAIYCALVVLFGDKITAKSQEKESKYRLLLSNFTLFSIINISVICLYAILVSSVSIVSGVASLIFASMFLKTIFNTSKQLVGIYPFTMLTLIGFLKLNVNHSVDGYLLLAALSAVAVLLFSFMNLFSDNMKKGLQIASSVILIIAFISNGMCFASLNGWTIPMFISTLIILGCMVYLSVCTKNKMAFHFQPLILIVLFHGIYKLFIPNRIEASVFMSLLCFGTFLFFYLFKIKKIGLSFRTLTSDILFLAVCALGVLINNYEVSCVMWENSQVSSLFPTIANSFICIGLMFGILVILTFEKIQSIMGKVSAFFLPFTFILLYLPISRLVAIGFQSVGKFVDYWESESICFFLLLSIIVVYAIAFLFIKNKNSILKRLQIPLAIEIPLLSFIGFFHGIFEYSNSYYPAYIWLVTIYYVANLVCVAKDKGKCGLEFNSVKATYFHVSGILLLFASLFTAEQIMPLMGVDFFLKMAYYFEKWAYFLLVPAMISIMLFSIYAFYTFVQKKEEDFYIKHLYLFSRIAIMVFAITCSAFYLMEMYNTPYYAIICSVLIAISCLAFYVRKENVFCIIPLAFIYPILFKSINIETLHHLNFGATVKSLAFMTSMCTTVAFVVFVGLGRLLHSKFYSQTNINNQSRILIDWIDVINVVAPFTLIFNDNEYWQFAGFLMLALYFLNYFNRFGKGIPNRVLLTIVGCALSMTYWNQPFFRLNPIIRMEFTLLPFILFAIALKYIWENQRKVCNMILFVVSCIGIVILGLDAVVSEELLDVLILGTIALCMLIGAFFMKRKTWFLLSSNTLTILAVYMTRNFWMSLAWWIYLLATGVILISIAATNETFKQKGQSGITSRVGKLFFDWEW
ncbi:MAG: hypothetical protein WAX04_11875 [Oscillospiraceae bacterium]